MAVPVVDISGETGSVVAEVGRACREIGFLTVVGHGVSEELVETLVGGHQRSALDELSDRERSVLSLVAEGRSSRAIANHLYLSTRAVERHVQSVFQKLRLPDTEDDNRRVLAVLALLGS